MSRIFDALQQHSSERGGEISPESLLEGFPLQDSGRFPLSEQADSIELHPQTSQHLIARTDPQGLGAEKFRQLCAILQRRQKTSPRMKTILVTSSVRGEGKSFVSANLAITFAQQRQKVLLIDGDLRGGNLHQVLGADVTTGISEWSEQKLNLRYFFRRIESPSLWFLSAGRPPEQPLEVLQLPGLEQMLREAHEDFDWIVIDSSPLPPFADSNLWAQMADATLLVVREGFTPKKLLEKCVESIPTGKLLGMILNEAGGLENNYYREYYRARTDSGVL